MPITTGVLTSVAGFFLPMMILFQGFAVFIALLGTGPTENEFVIVPLLFGSLFKFVIALCVGVLGILISTVREKRPVVIISIILLGFYFVAAAIIFALGFGAVRLNAIILFFGIIEFTMLTPILICLIATFVMESKAQSKIQNIDGYQVSKGQLSGATALALSIVALISSLHLHPFGIVVVAALILGIKSAKHQNRQGIAGLIISIITMVYLVVMVLIIIISLIIQLGGFYG